MDEESDPTRTSDRAPTPPRVAAGETPRFIPGAVVGDRYRIVSLLGRGGMGEVYRADDLRLGQAVALKFLPEAVAADPVRLARFIDEVRLARSVTHANVCRVHDVGDASGQPFLSMEYVDGEDLASLIRRAGRLSRERGIEVAPQLCLGLAAAHERGVLHRDLKPANVMVDARGRARLTDFGLAMDASAAARPGEVAGTPAYMAPEQLAGGALDERTDVYALGLVLYEIFAGHPAFTAKTLPELLRLQRETAPLPPSTHAPGLDQDLERLILRCLEKAPENRPASAIAVAAALPGGDPLAALVAAGETPPPELVAAGGGGDERVPLAAAWAALAVIVLGLPLAMHFMERLSVLHGVPLEKPPEVLVERAREAAVLAGADPGSRMAWGFEQDREAPPERRLRFWYRGSPGGMNPLGFRSRVTPEDPPLRPGMVRVRVDTEGRLLELLTVPAGEGAPVRRQADWPALLRLTGVPPSSLAEATPMRPPPLYADERRAWARDHGPPIEAAALGGHVVFLSTLAEEADGDGDRGAAVLFSCIWAASLAFAAFLALRNLRTGRGDRAGALRLFAWGTVARFAYHLLLATHGQDLDRERSVLILAASRALYLGGLLWLLYLAIEPAIRRRWPSCLVSWTRVLHGRLRDPRVGRDILAGLTAAVVSGLLWTVARQAGGVPARPLGVDVQMLLGLRPFLAGVLDDLTTGVLICLLIFVLALLVRVLCRDLRLAVTATSALFTLLAGLMVGFHGPLEMLVAALVTGMLAGLILRFGMLAFVVIGFVLGTPGAGIPATLALGSWYGQASLGRIVLVFSLAGWGLYTATGGRPFGTGRLIDD